MNTDDRAVITLRTFPTAATARQRHPGIAEKTVKCDFRGAQVCANSFGPEA
jgi:hypothetical protein